MTTNMIKKQKTEEKNFNKKPIRKKNLNWSQDKDKKIIIEMENTGPVNKIFQKLFKKPRISYIYLDDIGSFIWNLSDGNKSIHEIGEALNFHYGETVYPLYERLSLYIQTLKKYDFIELT